MGGRPFRRCRADRDHCIITGNSRSAAPLNKTRKMGLRKRRKQIAKLHGAEKHPAVPQKGPRAPKARRASLPTLALTPIPRR